MEMKNEWIDVNKQLPEPGKNVKIKMDDGSVMTAYLCKRCKNEFREPITGGGILVWPEYWKDIIGGGE